MSNEHDIVSAGPQHYSVRIEDLPAAYREQYGDHIARIEGFNIGMLIPNAIVDLIH